MRLTVDLQYDFALNQPLSPFALAAIELLDPESPSYPLDVLSVIESTLDNPRQVLSAQQSGPREAVAQMKADGVEYEERIELLDDVTYPKPLADMLDGGVQALPARPSLGRRPRAVPEVGRPGHVRAGLTFTEYVAYYGLARSEGLVLRYLADAYKALRQTVPDEAKTEELPDLIEWLGEIVRQVDSSLLDEWERLRHPARGTARLAVDVRAGHGHVERAGLPGAGPQRAVPRVGWPRSVSTAELGALDADSGWDASAWADAMEEYFEAHERDRHRAERARSRAADHRHGPAGPVDRPADLRRPGG